MHHLKFLIWFSYVLLVVEDGYKVVSMLVLKKLKAILDVHYNYKQTAVKRSSSAPRDVVENINCSVLEVRGGYLNNWNKNISTATKQHPYLCHC